jgi:hypothetical protein
MKKGPARQTVKKEAAAMVRCLRIWRGSVAFLDCESWINTKPMDKTAERTRSTMMRALCHGHVVPPHCRARRRQMTARMSTLVP